LRAILRLLLPRLLQRGGGLRQNVRLGHFHLIILRRDPSPLKQDDPPRERRSFVEAPIAQQIVAGGFGSSVQEI
jgi:hypothetical protein